MMAILSVCLWNFRLFSVTVLDWRILKEPCHWLVDKSEDTIGKQAFSGYYHKLSALDMVVLAIPRIVAVSKGAVRWVHEAWKTLQSNCGHRYVLNNMPDLQSVRIFPYYDPELHGSKLLTLPGTLLPHLTVCYPCGYPRGASCHISEVS